MARNRGGKIEKQKVFIFVEGETEQKYFDFLRQKLRLHNVKIKTIVLNNSGQTWIEKAKRFIKNDSKLKIDSATKLFVVFDKDEISASGIEKMLKKAKEESFEVGFSNTSFEVWLLAHFEEMTPKLLSKEILKKKLGNHLKNEYIKADTSQLETIINNFEKAVKNTSQIAEINFEYQSTTIGSLISKIR